MGFSHVIFDLDGTLLNTLDDLAAACNYACRRMGWPEFAVDAYRQKAGNGMPKLIRRFMPAELAGNDAAYEAAAAAFHEYYDAHKEDHTALYEGVADMLQALKTGGVSVSVLSNKDDAAVKPLVANYFGAGVFDVVQGRTDAYPAKPAPPLTLAVLGQLGAAAEDALYVGDSNVDVETGHNVGMPVAGVAWGFRGQAELKAAGAEYIAQTPADITALALGA